MAEPIISINNEDAPKIKIEVYYWPNTNARLGHIACVVKENGGNNRQLYVSPNTIVGNGGIKEHNITTDDSMIEKDLDHELRFFNSPDVIKIELDESNITFDEFAKRMEQEAAPNLESYNLLTRNCAHLTNKALSIAYDPTAKQPGIGLLPSTVAKRATTFINNNNTNQENKDLLTALSKKDIQEKDYIDINKKGINSIILPNF